MVLTDFRSVCAVQGIENHRRAVALSAFPHTAQNCFCRHCYIHCLKFREAVGTVSAVVGTVFSEIPQDIVSQTLVREAVECHLFQAFLLPLADQRCRLGIFTLLCHIFDKELVCDHILSRIQQNTFRRKAVPACSSGLLIIAFHVFRHIIMDDVPHIRFIDSHAEGVCRYHDLLPVVNKVFLVFFPFQIGKARVISCDRIPFLFELFTDLLHIFSGQTVNNATVCLMLRKKGLCSRKFVFRLLYRKFQILPVKTRYQTYRVTQRQQCLDIVPHLFCCRCRKGSDHRTRGKLIYKLCDFQVTWAEILSPLGDTVCLIHANHRNLHRLHRVQKLRCQKALRSDIDNLVSALHGESKCFPVLRCTQRAVQKCSVNSRLVQGGYLILHQGNQRRYYQRNPRQQKRRNLIAQRFSRAGRHDAEHILPGKKCIHQHFLSLPEGVVTEVLF